MLVTKSIKPHMSGEGIHKLYFFDNGYGASVLNGRGSYGGQQGLWELAVLYDIRESLDDYALCYSTEVTDDVKGHLSEQEVEQLLVEIDSLLQNDECTHERMP